jgi:hypothetical protein
MVPFSMECVVNAASLTCAASVKIETFRAVLAEKTVKSQLVLDPLSCRL